MFNKIIGYVTDPQFAIDAVDLAICFEEEYLSYDNELEVALDDIFWFNVDMMAEMLSI